MPRHSPVNDLTKQQRHDFEQQMIARNFTDWDGVEVWLKENGYDVSRSAAYRYGSKIKKRLQSVRDSTEAARLIAEAAPDDADLRSAAVISMVQSELFDVMVALQDIDEAEPAERVGLLKEAAKSVLDMTKASLMQKNRQDEVSAKAAAAADKVVETVKRNGLSSEVVDAIKRDILGVAA